MMILKTGSLKIHIELLKPQDLKVSLILLKIFKYSSQDIAAGLSSKNILFYYITKFNREAKTTKNSSDICRF